MSVETPIPEPELPVTLDDYREALMDANMAAKAGNLEVAEKFHLEAFGMVRKLVAQEVRS